MNQIHLVQPTIRSITAQLPSPSWTTDELLQASGRRFSDKLRDMLTRLGVDKRHSVLTNFPSVLFEGAEPELAISGSVLAAQAARRCIEQANVCPEEIGLVLGVTSSPSRLLPSLVCDLFAQMPELRRDAINFSLSYMGCSAIAKAVECARWFLSCHPDQQVLVSFLDAVTPLSPPLPGNYAYFSEIAPEERQATTNVMHGFLFGDATVAMLLCAEGRGPRFGLIKHLTNEHVQDAELGTVPDGGSDLPVVYGRRAYTLSPEVTQRGTFYATQTVTQLLESEACVLRDLGEASMVLIHSGSERILDGLCGHFGIARSSAAVASSYRILREYGNTIGCSVPLMLADPVQHPEGVGVMIAFGFGFSCGAGTITVPSGGWAP